MIPCNNGHFNAWLTLQTLYPRQLVQIPEDSSYLKGITVDLLITHNRK